MERDLIEFHDRLLARRVQNTSLVQAQGGPDNSQGEEEMSEEREVAGSEASDAPPNNPA